MANCAKCGTGFIRKRKDGRFKCKRCGFLPRDKHLDRSGFIHNGVYPSSKNGYERSQES